MERHYLMHDGETGKWAVVDFASGLTVALEPTRSGALDRAITLETTA